MLLTQLVGLGAIMAGYAIIGAIQGGSSSSSTTTTSSSSVSEPDYRKETMDYCYNLSESELRDYVESNYDLSRYCSHIDLDRDKYHVCSDIAEVAHQLGRSFTDRYDRY